MNNNLASLFTAKFVRAFSFVFVFAVILSASQFTAAQTDDDLAGSYPPPLKFMSDSERSKLDAEIDVKDRTKLALDLMDVRLKNAETLFAKGEFETMYKELGSFHALMDDTLQYLDLQSTDRRKVLNNYKRFEIGLRKLAPRIQLLRREIPLEYDPYLKILVRGVRDAREKAVEPLFGDQYANSESKDD
jgi:hypothetical protein